MAYGFKTGGRKKGTPNRPTVGKQKMLSLGVQEVLVLKKLLQLVTGQSDTPPPAKTIKPAALSTNGETTPESKKIEKPVDEFR